jgi:hypothetical protein
VTTTSANIATTPMGFLVNAPPPWPYDGSLPQTIPLKVISKRKRSRLRVGAFNPAGKVSVAESVDMLDEASIAKMNRRKREKERKEVEKGKAERAAGKERDDYEGWWSKSMDDKEKDEKDWNKQVDKDTYVVTSKPLGIDKEKGKWRTVLGIRTFFPADGSPPSTPSLRKDFKPSGKSEAPKKEEPKKDEPEASEPTEKTEPLQTDPQSQEEPKAAEKNADESPAEKKAEPTSSAPTTAADAKADSPKEPEAKAEPAADAEKPKKAGKQKEVDEPAGVAEVKKGRKKSAKAASSAPSDPEDFKDWSNQKAAKELLSDLKKLQKRLQTKAGKKVSRMVKWAVSMMIKGIETTSPKQFKFGQRILGWNVPTAKMEEMEGVEIVEGLVIF